MSSGVKSANAFLCIYCAIWNPGLGAMGLSGCLQAIRKPPVRGAWRPFVLRTEGLRSPFQLCIFGNRFLAEWMVNGYPSDNVWPLDLKRFGALQSSRTFLRHRVMEVMRK